MTKYQRNEINKLKLLIIQRKCKIPTDNFTIVFYNHAILELRQAGVFTPKGKLLPYAKLRIKIWELKMELRNLIKQSSLPNRTELIINKQKEIEIWKKRLDNVTI